MVPLRPPVRAWLTWQATPGTFGSSKALMQTLSFLPMNRKVVLTQGKSSALVAPAVTRVHNSVATNRVRSTVVPRG